MTYYQVICASNLQQEVLPDTRYKVLATVTGYHVLATQEVTTGTRYQVLSTHDVLPGTKYQLLLSSFSQGLEQNLAAVSAEYGPGWTVRLYHNLLCLFGPTLFFFGCF